MRDRDEFLLSLLEGLSGYVDADIPILTLKIAKHYGIVEELIDFILENPDTTMGEVGIAEVFLFREKPDRIVWTEEEYNEKVASGEISRYDVAQMADGFVPPQE